MSELGARSKAAQDNQDFAEANRSPGKKSAAQQLVELAFECYDLGVDTGLIAVEGGLGDTPSTKVTSG